MRRAAPRSVCGKDRRQSRMLGPARDVERAEGRTGQTALPESPSVLPSLRSSSCQHQISPLPSSVRTPTQVRRALLTRIESDEVEGVEREMAAVVGANEGPTVTDERGVWSASCAQERRTVSSASLRLHSLARSYSDSGEAVEHSLAGWRSTKARGTVVSRRRPRGRRPGWLLRGGHPGEGVRCTERRRLAGAEGGGRERGHGRVPAAGRTRRGSRRWSTGRDSWCWSLASSAGSAAACGTARSSRRARATAAAER